jgi:hypothetical protein
MQSINSSVLCMRCYTHLHQSIHCRIKNAPWRGRQLHQDASGVARSIQMQKLNGGHLRHYFRLQKQQLSVCRHKFCRPFATHLFYPRHLLLLAPAPFGSRACNNHPHASFHLATSHALPLSYYTNSPWTLCSPTVPHTLNSTCPAPSFLLSRGRHIAALRLPTRMGWLLVDASCRLCIICRPTSLLTRIVFGWPRGLMCPRFRPRFVLTMAE